MHRSRVTMNSNGTLNVCSCAHVCVCMCNYNTSAYDGIINIYLISRCNLHGIEKNIEKTHTHEYLYILLSHVYRTLHIYNIFL